ncbi:hypothetical protein [Natrinema sp. SYSU A 869]|uniref:hypothetical protein n=1 Tax=Natrinema sp. SYSU A 869 TaxID=2871694 RepID=UPI001CA44298|nr:hypothetical protein [Natrinema sp. SYSU A 869]
MRTLRSRDVCEPHESEGGRCLRLSTLRGGRQTVPPLASAGHIDNPFFPVILSMINAIRSILKEAISLVIAIITFPLRALRRLL